MIAAIRAFIAENPSEGFFRRIAAVGREGPNRLVGPCPLCGGEDRFVVLLRPTRAKTLPGAAWAFCRRCGERGDQLTWAMLVGGFDPKEQGGKARFLRDNGYLKGGRSR